MPINAEFFIDLLLFVCETKFQQRQINLRAIDDLLNGI